MKKILISMSAFLAAFLAACSESSSIGVIGGADGPTAVFITSKFPAFLIPTVIAVVVVMIFVLIYTLTHCNK